MFTFSRLVSFSVLEEWKNTRLPMKKYFTIIRDILPNKKQHQRCNTEKLLQYFPFLKHPMRLL